MTEPIIINDVDVSQCCFLGGKRLPTQRCFCDYLGHSKPNCEQNPDCYYKQKERYWKQLQQEEEKNARLTEELEEYKEEVRRLRNYR